MKLKFRAEAKDWMMFGGYCIVLLYFVAIAVLNVIQFAKGDLDHPFHGFNPFPAFTNGYLGLTLLFYVIALVASIFSVSDRFFDVDKGFGFSIGSKKAAKGYSKWLDASTMKGQLDRVDIQADSADAGGIPLINDGKRMWVDNGESHTMILGATGSGKTQIGILPLVKSLAKHGESMIVTDPKGEIFEKTSGLLKDRGYNILLLNFRNPQNGSGWNPLDMPYRYYKEGNNDKAIELTDDLALNILYDPSTNNDPFWEKTAADYFSGICLGLFEDAAENEININSVNTFTTVGEERCGSSTYDNEYFKLKDKNSSAYINASGTISAPEETKGSILSVFKQKIKLFASRENISEMLSHSDFDLKDIGRKKTAVFIIIQDEKKTYHPLVTIFIKQCYEALVDCAQENGGKLKFRTNFILDEFANMPPLKDVESMVSAARSRDMRFFFVIQNISQLSTTYSKEVGDTIRSNCTNLIYLLSTELSSLEEISKLCGEIRVKVGKDDKEHEETRPLVTISDLQKMEKNSIIVLRHRFDPFKTKIKPDWQIDWGKKYKPVDYTNREKEPLHIFDLKGFVDEKRKEKMNELISKAMPSGFPGMKKPAPGPKTPISLEAMLKNVDAAIAREEAKSNQGVPVAKIDPVRVAVPVTKEPVKPSKPSIKTGKKVSALESKQSDINVVPKVQETKKEPKINISSEDFAARITNKVNKTVNKSKTESKVSKNETKSVKSINTDYVTDDQFFDDFFADDED